MKKIIIILLICSLLVIGCTQTQNVPNTNLENNTPAANVEDLSNNPVEAPNTTENCAELTSEYQKLTCYEKQALENSDYSMCDNLEFPASPFDCKIKIVLQDKEYTKCDTMSSVSGDMQSDKDRCNFKVAEELLDVSYCDKLSEQAIKNVCYNTLAGRLGDSSVCENIILTGQISTIATFESDSCYHNVVCKTSDTSKCENIVDDEIKEACLSITSCYFD